MELTDNDRTELNTLRMITDKYNSKRAEYARNYYNKMKASDPTFSTRQNDKVRKWATQNKLKNPKPLIFGPEKRIGRPPVFPKAKPEPKKRGRPLKTYNFINQEMLV